MNELIEKLKRIKADIAALLLEIPRETLLSKLPASGLSPAGRYITYSAITSVVAALEAAELRLATVLREVQ